jgi:FKBP-type peptidyl-prolyl cis-trans isomerase 2
MKTGEFVLIDYVGKVKDSGEIFDITKEDTAKKEGVYKKEFRYGPVPIIIDAEFVLPGLNEAVKEMEVGQKKNVELLPEKAFGKRSEELIKLIPETQFHAQGIEPEVGRYITINRLKGKVMSIDGGRVRVDFNHPLAGKTLVYEIELVGTVSENSEKVKAVVYYFIGVPSEDVKVEVKDKEVEIIFAKKFDILTEAKQTIAETITKWTEIEKVRFVDVFEKTK